MRAHIDLLRVNECGIRWRAMVTIESHNDVDDDVAAAVVAASSRASRDMSSRDGDTDVGTSRAAAHEAGDAQKMIGNEYFARGAYEDAITAYTAALRCIGAVDDAVDASISRISALTRQCGEGEGEGVEVKDARAATYYANRAACFLKLRDYARASADATRAIAIDGAYTKAYARRAVAREALEDVEGALDDYKRVLERAPSDVAARDAVARLTPIVDAKREEMKEEVIATMKNLGNSLLGNFGLSLDNFKAEKDPATGSYSINFINQKG